jgi:hypothetical protein
VVLHQSMLACFAWQASSHRGATGRRRMADFGPHYGSTTLSNHLWCTPQVLQVQIGAPSVGRDFLYGGSPSQLLHVRQASREDRYIRRSLEHRRNDVDID